MRPSCAIAILLLAMVLLSVEAGKISAKRTVQCPQLTSKLVCTNSASFGLKYFDGCNRCRCSKQELFVAVCSSRQTCASPSTMEGRAKNKAQRVCGRWTRKVQRRKRKQAKKGSAKVRTVFNSCFNSTRVCSKRPGVSYFDGCNRCKCHGGQDANSGASTMGAAPVGAACTEMACPSSFPFTGTRKQLKQLCRRLGAKIDKNKNKKRKMKLKRHKNGKSKCVNGVRPNGKPCRKGDKKNRRLHGNRNSRNQRNNERTRDSNLIQNAVDSKNM